MTITSLAISRLNMYKVVDIMKSKPISVRLSTEAMKKCNEALSQGYSMSAYVEQSILKNQVQNKSIQREVLKHFCQIESILATMKDGTTKENIRAELNEVCQILKSSQETM